jgi:hypothetical protein
MKRIIRLTESDLTRIVKRTIKEMYSDDESQFNEYFGVINQMKFDFEGASDCRELRQINNSVNNLYTDIHTSKDLEYTEKNDLLQAMDELTYDIEESLNDCRDDYRHGDEYEY